MRGKRVIVLVVVLCAVCGVTLADEQVNLLDNPGFEELDEKGHALFWSPPGGWKEGFCEMVTEDVHGGKRAFSWKWRDLGRGITVINALSARRPKTLTPAPWNAGVRESYMPLWPGVTYTVSAWAKGMGEIQPFVCAAEYGLQRGTKVLKAKAVSNEWEQYTWTYTTPTDLVGNCVFVIFALRGKEGDHMSLDDLAFSCSREDHEAHQRPASMDATLKVHLPGGTVALTVGYTKDDRASVATMLGNDPETTDQLQEIMRNRLKKKTPEEEARVKKILGRFGHRQLTCPVGEAVDSKAQEGEARFVFDLKRQESRCMLAETILTLACKRTGQVGLSGGLTTEAGDRFPIDETWVWSAPDAGDWQALQKLADGSFWGAAERDEIQVKKHVIWKDPYYVWPPDLTVVPVSRENAAIIWFVLLQFHTWKAGAEQIVLDVPKGVKVLDKFEDSRPDGHNVLPAEITREDITRDGKAYTRFVLSYKNRFRDWYYEPGWYGWVPSWTPVILTHDAEPAQEEFTLYFRRQTADGVVREVWNRVPILMLPRADGGRCKRFVIDLWQRFSGKPFYYSRYSRAERACVGRSYARIRSMTFPLFKDYNETKQYIDEVKALLEQEKVARVYWSLPDVRFTSSRLWKDWFEEHPEFQAINMAGRRHHGHFCPTMMLKAARENLEPIKRFRRECRKWHDLLGVPGALHLEEGTWLGDADGYKGFCYCPACKKAFADLMGDPSVAELSNKQIKERYGQYYRELDGTPGCVERPVEPEQAWSVFMVQQWGKALKEFKKILNEYDSLLFLHEEGHIFPVMRWKGCVDMFHTATGECDSPGWMLQSMERASHRRRYYRCSTDTRLSSTLHCHEPPDARINKNKVIRAAILSQGGGIDVQGGFGLGGQYYLAEGTKFVARYEDYFWKGQLVDYLFKIDRPKGKWNALQLGQNILLILFNDGPEPMTVPVHYKGLEWAKTIHIEPANVDLREAVNFTVEIPPFEVATVEITAPDKPR